jgi:hypothetical protein
VIAREYVLLETHVLKSSIFLVHIFSPHPFFRGAERKLRTHGHGKTW